MTMRKLFLFENIEWRSEVFDLSSMSTELNFLRQEVQLTSNVLKLKNSMSVGFCGNISIFRTSVCWVTVPATEDGISKHCSLNISTLNST